MPAGLGAAPSKSTRLGFDNDNDSSSDEAKGATHGKPNHLAVHPPASQANAEDENDDDEDDYMNFALPEDPASASGSTKGETSLQRAARLRREAAARARPKSKAELAREEQLRREQALATKLDASNRGFKMMAKLGFRDGDALGPVARAGKEHDTQTANSGAAGSAAEDDGHGAKKGWAKLTEPLAVDVKLGREGIGMENEKKRKFRAEVEARMAGEKRVKEEVGDYRVRQAQEREERRCEGLLVGAQKVAIGLEDDARSGTGDEEQQQNKAQEEDKKPLADINVLWRGLIRERREREREKRMRVDLTNSLSRRPGYEPNADEDAQDELAYDGKLANPESRKEQVLESELDEDDQELQEFVELPAKERLAKIVTFLREKWWYCFWCKMRYDSADMDGCPGLDEDDHD